MRVAGEGSDLWHVRVDLIAPDDDPSRVGQVAQALLRNLHGDSEDASGGAAVDQGTGVEGQPVLGLTFWVRADNVGAAAEAALATARRAGSGAGVGPAYYDVSLVPKDAVLMPWQDHEIRPVD